MNFKSLTSVDLFDVLQMITILLSYYVHFAINIHLESFELFQMIRKHKDRKNGYINHLIKYGS